MAIPSTAPLRTRLDVQGLSPRHYGPHLAVLYTGVVRATPEEMYRAWTRGDRFPCPSLKRLIGKFQVPPHIELIWLYCGERGGGLWIDLRNNPLTRGN